MVDIADNALEDEAKALVYGMENRVTFIESILWDLPIDFPIADWGYCVDVSCASPRPPGRHPQNIRVTCRALFTQVYDWADMRLGINYTTIMEGPEERLWKIKQFWPKVERVISTEHKRRYIYICCEEFFDN